MENESTYERLKRIYRQGEGEMKRYNHAYTIAFSVDTDEADPYKVSPENLLAAIELRAFELRLHKTETLEAIDCWDSVDNKEEGNA